MTSSKIKVYKCELLEGTEMTKAFSPLKFVMCYLEKTLMRRVFIPYCKTRAYIEGTLSRKLIATNIIFTAVTALEEQRRLFETFLLSFFFFFWDRGSLACKYRRWSAITPQMAAITSGLMIFAMIISEKEKALTGRRDTFYSGCVFVISSVIFLLTSLRFFELIVEGGENVDIIPGAAFGTSLFYNLFLGIFLYRNYQSIFFNTRFMNQKTPPSTVDCSFATDVAGGARFQNQNGTEENAPEVKIKNRMRSTFFFSIAGVSSIAASLRFPALGCALVSYFFFDEPHHILSMTFFSVVFNAITEFVSFRMAIPLMLILQRHNGQSVNMWPLILASDFSCFYAAGVNMLIGCALTAIFLLFVKRLKRMSLYPEKRHYRGASLLGDLLGISSVLMAFLMYYGLREGLKSSVGRVAREVSPATNSKPAQPAAQPAAAKPVVTTPNAECEKITSPEKAREIIWKIMDEMDMEEMNMEEDDSEEDTGNETPAGKGSEKDLQEEEEDSSDGRDSSSEITPLRLVKRTLAAYRAVLASFWEFLVGLLFSVPAFFILHNMDKKWKEESFVNSRALSFSVIFAAFIAVYQLALTQLI